MDARWRGLRLPAALSSIRAKRAALGIGVVLLIALFILGAFPWGALKGPIERRLSAATGKPVTIASMTRRDLFSFNPVIEFRGVSIPQPDWAGPGKLAAIDHATIRFGAFGALFGQINPDAITIERGSIDLIRRADGTTNLGSGGGGRRALSLSELTVRDLTVRYRDAVQDRSALVSVRSDANGVRIAGSGLVTGAPVQIALEGPAVAAAAGKPWPFKARIAGGGALDITAEGRMDAPLDLQHMDLSLRTQADDLKRIDAVIEAGLFGTKPVALNATVRRDGGTWTIRRLAGTIGQSDITGNLTVNKHDGRVQLDGRVVSERLSFDDLSSVAGDAKATALERAEGLKIVPNTRISLAKLGETDGRIVADIRNVVSPRRPSAIKAIRGTLNLDHSRLEVDRLVIVLTRGTIGGRAVVDQREGRKMPLVTLDLKMESATLATLGGSGGGVDAPVRGRVLLTGSGDTVREAVGRSTGRIGLAAQNGVLPAKIAAALGFDAGRALTKGEDESARLRCVVAAIDVRDGLGTFDPLLIDTTLSGTRGVGSVRFPQEALAVTLTGAPKRDGLIRLPGAVTVSGTIRSPQIVVPKQVKSAGNVLKALGRAIGGKQGPLATDADCAGLAAHALR